MNENEATIPTAPPTEPCDPVSAFALELGWDLRRDRVSLQLLLLECGLGLEVAA